MFSVSVTGTSLLTSYEQSGMFGSSSTSSLVSSIIICHSDFLFQFFFFSSQGQIWVALKADTLFPTKDDFDGKSDTSFPNIILLIFLIGFVVFGSVT